MNRRRRIEALEEQLRARGAEFMIDDGFDEEMTESFLQHVLECETAEHKKLREWLAESGYVPPENLPDDRVSAELRALLDHLAFLGVVVEFADHLSDRELYAWLTDSEQLSAHIAPIPGNILHFDVIGSGSDQDNRLYLTYYASDEERAEWKAQFPDEELPPRKRPSYSRDVPKPSGQVGKVS
jgi:hypothetical protein